MTLNDFLFFMLAILTIWAGVRVIFVDNPLLSALHLVLAMVGVSGLFFILQAPFLGAVQILVYAGAVMVLFVMVLMLIDVKHMPSMKFTGGTISLATKGLATGLFAGLIAATLVKRADSWAPKIIAAKSFTAENIAHVLFTKYLLAFEVLGLLLLVIPIGVVALSRVRGGTHDR